MGINTIVNAATGFMFAVDIQQDANLRAVGAELNMRGYDMPSPLMSDLRRGTTVAYRTAMPLISAYAVCAFEDPRSKVAAAILGSYLLFRGLLKYQRQNNINESQEITINSVATQSASKHTAS